MLPAAGLAQALVRTLQQAVSAACAAALSVFRGSCSGFSGGLLLSILGVPSDSELPLALRETVSLSRFSRPKAWSFPRHFARVSSCLLETTGAVCPHRALALSKSLPAQPKGRNLVFTVSSLITCEDVFEKYAHYLFLSEISNKEKPFQMSLNL